MKTIFSLICLVAIATCQLSLPPEDMRKVLQYNTECQKTSGATQQEIMATITGKFSDSPALKDHLFCLGTKLKFIGDDGQIQRDVIKTKMGKIFSDEAKVDDMLDKCILPRDNVLDTAYDSIKCFAEKRNMIMGS